MDMRLEVVVVAVSDVDGRHEKETGQPDPDWPRWYAQYMVDESAGQGRGEGEAGGA